jgi:hypothetical protein
MGARMLSFHSFNSPTKKSSRLGGLAWGDGGADAIVFVVFIVFFFGGVRTKRTKRKLSAGAI